jgi:hypothetical protein
MTEEEEFDLRAMMVADIARIENAPPRERRLDPSSALYWLPRITSVLPEWVPRTEIIPYDHIAAVCMLEGQAWAGWPKILASVADAAKSIGYPVFIRSDLASAKHSGPSAYRATDESELSRVLGATVEDNELKFWLEGGCDAFMVREFLTLEAPFVAFHGLPIAREWRLFANASEIVCAHPYWPADVLKFDGDEPTGWQEQLATTHEQPQEWQLLCDTAMAAARACELDTAWSVDFARDVNGKWWLIDMALMNRSWHWPECPNAT